MSTTEPRRRLDPVVRRGLILDAAGAVFAERGYHEASMGEIARSAGIAAATIYDHFAGKAELQNVLLRRTVDQLMEVVARRTDGAEDAPEAQFRAGIEAFFDFVEQHPYAWRTMFRDPPGDAAVAATHAEVADLATRGIAAVMSRHAPAHVVARPGFEQDVTIYAQLLKTAINGLAAWWWDHREVDRAVLVDRVMRFCWTGLEAWIQP